MKTVDSSKGPRPASRRMLSALLISALLPLAGRAQMELLSSGQNEPQNGANAELPWQARDKFDRVRFMNEASSHYIYRESNHSTESLIFFPPVPPPLDSEIPALAPLDAGPPAPQELSAFVGEVFYPLLGARLVSDDLTKALRARIVAYRDAKIAIQNELRSRVLQLKDADKDSRDRQLAALVALQAPRIAELEDEAERLRQDLRRTGILGLPAGNPGSPGRLGWNIRSSRDTPSTPAELRTEANAVRGAAYLEDGLSLQQRLLLEEAAAELETRADADRSRARAAPGSRLIFFSPEKSRILLPEDPRLALQGKVDGYLLAKASLKSELLDALHGAEDTYGDDRRNAMARLAASQAPRITALEATAEDIRRELSEVPSLMGRPPSPSLPPELTSRIAAYRRHKVELLRTLRAMLVAPSPRSSEGAADAGSKADDAVSRVQSWLHDSKSTTEVPISNLRVSVAEFDRIQTNLIAALNKEESGIREGLADFVRTTNGPADRKSVNDLLRDFEGARLQQEIWDRYRDYQTAVLAPGLSAGQRRVLFDSGIEQLGLPLPGGEGSN